MGKYSFIQVHDCMCIHICWCYYPRTFMQNVSLCGYYAWKRVCIRKCKDNFFINTYIEYVVCRNNYAKTCTEEQLKVMETIMKSTYLQILSRQIFGQVLKLYWFKHLFIKSRYEPTILSSSCVCYDVNVNIVYSVWSTTWNLWFWKEPGSFLVQYSQHDQSYNNHV